jgi:hypothetical protein
MDREKVAAGIAVENEKLLPYLAMPDGSGGTNTFSPLPSIEFGYTFIENTLCIVYVIVFRASNRMCGSITPVQSRI